MKKPLYQIMLGCLVCMSPQVHSADINQQVANAYNDGIVRCTNAECAQRRRLRPGQISPGGVTASQRSC
jgi:hypothetical protein